MSEMENQNGNRHSDEDQNSKNGEEQEMEIEDYQQRQYVYILPCDIPDLWSKIEDKLKGIKQKRYNLKEIVDQISQIINLHYRFKKNINVMILSEFLEEELLTRNQIAYYQNELIPSIANMALELKIAFPQDDPIKLLLAGEENEQKFTKYQIAVLLSNMFFCTLHEQISTYDEFPKFFDFSRIYLKGTMQECNILKKEKLKFIFNYFDMVLKGKINLDLCVSFERVNYQYDRNVPSKEVIESKIRYKSEVQVFDDKTIESGLNLIQVTFANMFVGGGVLGKGAIQEEIRYLISPECLVGIILFSKLEKNEAIVIQGAQQVSDYEGYGAQLKFKGEYNDDKLTVQEQNNMLNVIIVGMDAINFTNNNINDQSEFIDQYNIKSVMREIVKAYTAFGVSKKILTNGQKKGVITGNWGCGDFGGDKELKFIIQWIASSWARRSPLYYCTYGDSFLKAKIEEIISLLPNNQYDLYCGQKKDKYIEISLFDFITLNIN